MMCVLKVNNWGVGEVLNKYDECLIVNSDLLCVMFDIVFLDELVVIGCCVVLVDWLDYNGYMNEVCYGMVFFEVIDCLMEIIGCIKEYIVIGGSYFIGEIYICYLDEVYLG